MVDEESEPISEFSIQVPGVSITAGSNGLAVISLSSFDTVDIYVYSDNYNTLALKVAPNDVVVEAVLIERYEKLAPVMVYGSLTSEGVSNTESIDEDHLRERAGNSLSESMDGIPGVHAVNTGVGISKPMIRGFVGTRVNVVQGGVLQEGQQWGMDHGLEIDQFSVENVSIITGVHTLESGPASASGIVSIPNASVPYYGFHGSVNAIGKSNNNTIGQSTSLSYRNSTWNIKGRFSLQDFGDFRVPADQFSYNGYNLSLPDGILKNTAGTEMNGSLDFGFIGTGGYWSINASRFYQKIGLFPGAMGIPRQYDISDVGDKRDVDIPFQLTRHDKVAASFVTNKTNDANGYWKLTLSYQHNHREERSAPHAHGLTYVDPNNTLGLGLDLQTIQFTGFRTFSWLNANWKAGISSQQQVNNRSGWEFLLPTYFRQNYGEYLTTDFVLGTWNLSAGVRFDQAQMNVTGYDQPWYAAPDSLVERVPDFSSTYWAKSVSVGFANSWLGFDFTGQVSYSERIPAIAELASNGVHHGTFRHEVGNPDLDLEKGTLFELSIYREIVPKQKTTRYEFKATGWAYQYSNYIFLNPTGEFSPLPDAGQIYAYAHAPASLVGVEGHFGFAWGEHWGGSINYDQIYHSINTETGANLPFQPAGSISVIPEYSIGNWSFGVEGVSTFTQDKVAINEKITPGYFLLNAFLQYRVQISVAQSFDFRLRGQNLTNEEYLRHISRYRILNLPEQGVNFIAQLAYRF